MSHKPSKQDSWTSLLSELGVEEPVQKQKAASEPDVPPPVSHGESQMATSADSPAESPVKTSSKFGRGIVSEVPGMAKPGIPKKTEKTSFFDRLASISLFGAGTSEKINPKVIAPTVSETSGLVEEVLEPKKLQKVEETPKEPKGENRPQIGAVDPWSKIATQIGARKETALQETEPQTKQREETRPISKPVDEIPDIESMISFRDLPKKKKIETAPPAERVEHVSESGKTYAAPDSPPASPRREHASERREPREERRPDRYVSDKRGGERVERGEKGERGRRGRFDRNKHGDSSREELREELKDAPSYNGRRGLGDVDLAPPRKERGSSFADGLEDEETSAGRSRNRHSRSRKHGENRRPDRAYVDPQNEFEGGDFEEDYEVLTPPPEREYGPPRDVFADLFPEGTGSEMSHETHRPASESGQRTRGSKVRGASFPEESSVESETTGEENDPFSHFNKRGGRGSRADQSRRGGRRIDRQPEEDTVGEEAACSRESSSRGRGASGRKVRAIDEEPMDEQSLQEEQEMAQLHRNIPGWEDAILPIVESNIARHANHANRSNSAKKGGRNK